METIKLGIFNYQFWGFCVQKQFSIEVGQSGLFPSFIPSISNIRGVVEGITDPIEKLWLTKSCKISHVMSQLDLERYCHVTGEEEWQKEIEEEMKKIVWKLFNEFKIFLLRSCRQF